MGIKFLPTIILSASIFILLSFKSNVKNYETECASSEDGQVNIKIWDAKKGAKYQPEQARQDAIHAILFSGIAGGANCSTQPPMLNSSDAQEKFERIEKGFFSRKGKWSMFTRSSTTETTLPVNLGIKNWKVYQVAISKNELRKYLEEKKIIKPLNNGF